MELTPELRAQLRGLVLSEWFSKRGPLQDLYLTAIAAAPLGPLPDYDSDAVGDPATDGERLAMLTDFLA